MVKYAAAALASEALQDVDTQAVADCKNVGLLQHVVSYLANEGVVSLEVRIRIVRLK